MKTLLAFLAILIPLISRTEGFLDQQWSLIQMQALSAQENGFVCAPNALHDMMGLMMAGADGETENAFADAYFTGMNRKEVIQTSASLTRNLRGYRSLTSLWLDTHASLLPSYLNLANTSWQAHIGTAPLREDPKTASILINTWFQKQTNTPNLQVIVPPDIPEDPEFICINLSAFRGQWTEGLFKGDQTSSEVFHFSKESKLDVKMMRAKSNLRYYEDDESIAILLPYQQGQVKLLLVLPKVPGNLLTWIESQKSSPLQKIRENTQLEEVIVWLPIIDTRHQENWRSLWMQHDLRIPFQRTAQTNFIHINGNQPQPLYISLWEQTTWVRWDEWGTVARAVTMFGGDPFGGAPEPKPPKQFIANHPFFFAVIREQTGESLFAGIISHPSQLNRPASE